MPPDYLHDLRPYRPEQRVHGLIRVYGNNYIPELMKAWEEGFQKVQPDVQFTSNLDGTEAAMAGLYGGIADLAFIGREAYNTEIQAFRDHVGYAPLGLMISSGSFATPHKTFSLEIFVHQDNPLSQLTMQQVAAIFGCGCKTPKSPPIRTWGQLGLGGEWKDRPIHVYGYATGTGMARFFDRTALGGSGRWNDQLVDFDNGHDQNGDVINAGVYVLNALGKDSDGIAYANFLFQNQQVKPVALAVNAKEPYYQATPKTTWTREYPLTRFSTVYLNRPPGTPVDPKLREFLFYILSKEGMSAVIKDKAYIPLNKAAIEHELAKLR